MREGRIAWMAAATLLLGTSTVVRAEMPGDVPDKWRLGIGGMAASTYTDAALSSKSVGLGASINFEDTFGLPDNKDVWRFEVNWHINERQFLDFGYLELNRNGSSVLSDDVVWNDKTFQAGGTVSAGFKSEFPYAAWRYSFLDLPEVRISGSAGLVYLGITADLAATGSVLDSNGNAISGGVDEEVHVAFPVPQVGLQLDWAITKRLAIMMYLRQIYINDIEGIDGGIGESAFRVQWWYTKHCGISGGLDKESIDLKSYETGDKKARFRYEVRGFSLYLNFAF